MKKFIITLLVCSMLLTLSACGFSYTNTTTTTENGQTTTTTESTQIGNPDTSETLEEICEDGETYTFSLVIGNASDLTLTELYITEPGEAEYYNCLNEGVTIGPNEQILIEMSVDAEHLEWDFGILPDDDNGAVWFEGIDLSSWDPENDELEFSLDSEGWHLRG